MTGSKRRCFSEEVFERYVEELNRRQRLDRDAVVAQARVASIRSVVLEMFARHDIARLLRRTSLDKIPCLLAEPALQDSATTRDDNGS